MRRTRCPHCKGKLAEGQRIHPDCIGSYAEGQEAKAKRKAEKQARDAAKADRKATREKLEGMKRLGDLRKEAQAIFNRFIRLRDAGKPCICCGQPLGEQRYGGACDAGHYLSRGSHPNLAFDEVNVNAQRKGCNRPGGTSAAAFRLGMIARHGIEAVEKLEADQAPRRYRHDDYRHIKTIYAAKAKEIDG